MKDDTNRGEDREFAAVLADIRALKPDLFTTDKIAANFIGATLFAVEQYLIESRNERRNQRDMDWTTSPPTRPGWYWVMDATTPIAVQLGIVGDGTIDGVDEWTKDGYTGPYAGPIEPPKMTEGK